MTEPQTENSYRFDKVSQPLWFHSDSSASLSPPVLEGVVYKLTRVGLVVRRGAALFANRCTTYHDPEKKTDATTWMLDRSCTLLPAKAQDFVPKKRGVRPKGTWSITAAVQGVETFIDIYELTIDWPPSWAAAGYTSLVLGLPSLVQAVQWHEAISKVLADLGAAKGQSRPLATLSASVKEPAAPLDVTASSNDNTDAPEAPPASFRSTQLGVSVRQGEGEAAALLSPAAPEAVQLASTSFAVPSEAPGNVSAGSAPAPALAPAPASGPVSLDAGLSGAASSGHHGSSSLVDSMWGEDVPTDSESDEGDEEDEDTSAGPDEERWVPYRQTNGVAIYHHAAEGKKTGGEFMVSCVIRGRPSRVASALMRLRGNTTILGPVAHAEVLQTSECGGKEILRLILTASGYAGYFCAPREIILERMRKDEEDGVIVILFKSVDLPNEANAQGKDLYGRGLYRRPVRGVVAGGYTIAGLRGEGAASTESLVTCIVKADLGGVCAPESWAQPLASAAGWTDAFLDRILMSVHLLRDEVEQRRFAVQPFKLVASAKARLNEEGVAVDPKGAKVPASGGASAISSVSMLASGANRKQGSVLRPSARMASRRLSTADAAQVQAVVKNVVSIAEEEEEEEGGHGNAAAAAAPSPSSKLLDPDSMTLDIEHVRSLSLMPRHYWAEVQVPGTDAPFHVRGATYLKDRKKILAGPPAFQLGSLELLELPAPGSTAAGTPVGPTGVVEHVGRFVPSIRRGGAPFSIIINLVVPGSPMLSLVAVFCCEKHPSILGTPPARPMEQKHDWQPFDFVLHKFVYGSDETRNHMLKLVPHIASGSWMIKQSVGTKPAILGKALKTTYHCTPTYIEVDVDISANSVANYVTGMVRGATSSLVIDLAFVLEGTAPWELPECLLGALRLNHLDCNKASSKVDWSKELPLTAGTGGKL